MNKDVEKQIQQIRTGQDRSRILKTDPYAEEKIEARIKALEDEREFKKIANRKARFSKEKPKYKGSSIANLTTMIIKNRKRLEEIQKIKKCKEIESRVGRASIDLAKCKIHFDTPLWECDFNTDLREAGFTWSHKYKCWRANLNLENYNNIKEVIKKYED